MSSLRRLVLLVAACALVLAACGDDSGGGSADGGGGDTGTDDALVLPGDVDIPGVSDECETVAAAAAQAAGALSSVLAPGAELGDTAGFFDGAVEAAPEEIREDFAVLADALNEFGDALADAGADPSDPATFSDPDVLAAIDSASEALSDPAYEEASDNISAWAEANCEGFG